MEFDITQATIFKTLSGSRVYGTSTPESDYDYRGVAIPPLRWFFGHKSRFDQYEGGDDDSVIYDIRKFLKLATDNNPNVIELLYVPRNHWIITTPFWERMVEARDLFLSQKSYSTFRGYAQAQLKRIQSHRGWLLQGELKEPTREQFQLPEVDRFTNGHQVGAALDLVNVFLREDDIEIMLAEIAKLGAKAEAVALRQKIWDFLTFTLGMTKEEIQDKVEESAMKRLGLDDNLIDRLQREKSYRAAKRHYESWQKWKLERNEKRKELERLSGYDCYVDETEFLTDHGWKHFDAVTPSMKLATVYTGTANYDTRKPGWLEFQNYTERFDGTFSGNLYSFVGYHTDVMVTPNHRMLIRPRQKNLGTCGQLQLVDAASLPNCFDVMKSITAKPRPWRNPPEAQTLPIDPTVYMRIMGWFLSDGTFRIKNKKPVAIRISQKKGGRLSSSLTKFHKSYGNTLNASLYEYARRGNRVRTATIVEQVLDIRHPELVRRLFEDCGHKEYKHIPRWVFTLSQRLRKTLFAAMVKGDGTIRKHASTKDTIIYYTTLKQLADDVQELAVYSGWETSVYGPYTRNVEEHVCKSPRPMWQVHVGQMAPQFREMTRNNNIRKIPVKNKRIVCFTVPNGTLITRHNGHVGIHGNCKHGSHLARLLLMCEDILREHTIYVECKQVGFLRDIREGRVAYDNLMSWAQEMEVSLTELKTTTTLQHSPDRNAIEEMGISIVRDFHHLT